MLLHGDLRACWPALSTESSRTTYLRLPPFPFCFQPWRCWPVISPHAAPCAWTRWSPCATNDDVCSSLRVFVGLAFRWAEMLDFRIGDSRGAQRSSPFFATSSAVITSSATSTPKSAATPNCLRRKKCSGGMNLTAARRAARMHLGGPEQLKEEIRASPRRRVARISLAGRPFRRAHTPQKSRLHSRGDFHPRPRHRCQHRRLQHC